ncbi:hypothetical protein AVEN_151298-1 [Araneus ventricosus]|uniref:Uncharacterized protein n=1 Tax=Araneus ventricosus TaxID=182803 RepID=A0A4Y2RPC1_ARAVE|nr:hypothetical protein AVEN_151298-1 [Araneus ventricosus]
MFGKLCTHQYAVYLFYDLALKNCSVAPKVKHQIACLALGEEAPPLSFYQPFLLENEQTTDNSEVMTNEDESLPTVEIQNVELPDLDCPSVERNNDLFEKIVKVQEDLHKRFGSSTSGLQKLYSELNKISSEANGKSSFILLVIKFLFGIELVQQSMLNQHLLPGDL